MPHAQPITPAPTLLGEQDYYLFNEGTHTRLYDTLGAHPGVSAGRAGVYFAVWAPNAAYVAVIGDFNEWDSARHPLRAQGVSGIWAGFIPDVGPGTRYKYAIHSRHNDYRIDKADPFAFASEMPPLTASIVADLAYTWTDDAWLVRRRASDPRTAPMSIYELHLGSWRKNNGYWLSYRDLADQLPAYLQEQGFTHVEFLPVMEHPYTASWGYQVTGYFGPTARFGTPQDFMALVDALHAHNIGVILDWVPAHFPADGHGLSYFDGTHLFEHADPRKGWHPDWQTFIFNFGRHEVQSFLTSSALFWLDHYHIDGLRVDAVASMLYLDYSRKSGEWVPNDHGGRENLEAIAFLKHVNTAIAAAYPDVAIIAEESSAFPMVTGPTPNGLGFTFKWDMGWMHDTLQYFARDPLYRKFHQNDLTFHMMYATSEKYVMPLSHDEVVHGKSSLLGKMPGDDWQKFANLRLLFAYMYGQPGKKLLIMGSELAPWNEWNYDAPLPWNLLEHAPHAGMQHWLRDLNHFYQQQPALWELDNVDAGYEWIDCADAAHSVMSFLRRARSDAPTVVVICNFTPEPRPDYRIGLPSGGAWRVALNSDAASYDGSGVTTPTDLTAAALPWHGRDYSVTLTLPPLAALFLIPQAKPKRQPRRKKALAEADGNLPLA